MNRLMQSASVLTLAAAFAAAPVLATAQQTTDPDAGQAVGTVAQETEEAAGAAATAAGAAIDEVGQAAEAVGEAAAEATGDAVQAVGETVETVDQALEAEVIVVVPDQPAGTAEQPAAESSVTVIAEPANVTEAPAEAMAAAPVEEVRGTIVLQDDDSFLTSDLLDAAVYNATGEKIGDIDDAILSLDGTVEGVVIGVGGFLGIGEKHVAVEMQQMSINTNEGGEPQLVIDTTREALEAAPDFVTVEDQLDQAERQQMQEEPVGGMAPAGTAPTTGMAPAEGAATTTGN